VLPVIDSVTATTCSPLAIGPMVPGNATRCSPHASDSPDATKTCLPSPATARIGPTAIARVTAAIGATYAAGALWTQAATSVATPSVRATFRSFRRAREAA
jgi:hypothetical protein